MTKELFFKILKDGLKDFPESILADILFEYKERFDVGLSSGKTEEEIISELGNPQDIVNNYKNKHLQKYEENPTETFNTTIINDVNYQYEDTKFEDTNHENTSSKTSKKTSKGNRSTSNMILTVLICALGLFLFGPFAFGISVAILSIIFSFAATAFALVVSAIAVLFTKFGVEIIGISSLPSFMVDFPNSTLILTVVGCLLLAIFFICCLYYSVKLCIRLMKKLINFAKKKF